MRILYSVLILVTAFTATPALAQTPLKGRDSTIRGSQTFAMIVGISKYRYVHPLNYADKDAELFRDYLRSPAGGNVKNDNIFCLLNEKASNANFWGKGFQWLKAKKLQRGDRLFIYLAGHGDAIDEDQFFFLGYDCNPGGDKNNYLVSGAIQLFNLKKKIAGETSKGVEVFFIMDACRSNELPGGVSGQNFLNTAVSEKNAGEVIMLATGAGQESLEDASIGNGHGLFTYYLVDGLTGVADSLNPDNKISFREIESFVDKNVPSIAEQRFKRKQDPYFCCTENNNKIISIVDTAYLQKWLKSKKARSRGGNSFEGDENKFYPTKADTSLVQMYDLFNRAINSGKFTGNGSAEYLYQQLDKKYHNNPYTLDAKSTLAVEYINDAQARVNRYLSCEVFSTKDRQESFEAGERLKKAIDIMREDEPEFANSLLGRMYLLKSSGDFGTTGKNGDLSIAFVNAYAALRIDPNGAYINNRLALLHLENNRPDSALYYADKAVKLAPKWICALTTLSHVQKQQPSNPNTNPPTIPTARKPIKKVQFGGVVGGGASQTNPSITVSRNDTLQSVTPANVIKLDLGAIVQFNISNRLSFRPSAIVSTQGSDLTYVKTTATGGGTVSETFKIQTTTVTLTTPFVIRFSDKRITPYLMVGPAFSFLASQNEASSSKIPLKDFWGQADGGIGVDISTVKGHLIITPEIKYTHGLSNMNTNTGNYYTAKLTSLKVQNFTFSLYLRAQ